MLVSVCLPVYNGSAFIEQAVDSVLAQTHAELELIIVDDCSSDDSAQRILSLAKDNSKIMFRQNETRLGLFANYNRCLELSSGQLIKPMAQDDVLKENTIEQLSTPFHADETLALVSCAKGAPTYAVKEGDQAETLSPGKQEGQKVIEECLRTYRNLIGEPVAVMFKAEYSKLKFDSNYHSLGDLDLWFRILENANMYYVPRTLVTFREHEGSATSSMLRNLDWVLDFFRLGRQYQFHLERMGITQEQFFMGFIELAGGLIDKMSEQGKIQKSELDGFKEIAFYALRRSAQLAAKGREYDAIINSTSWRITEPLRAIMVRLGRSS